MSEFGGNVNLYPHQMTALDKMHDGCVLVGGVGTGKTITALAYYWRHHRERTLYIFTTARKRDDLDWQKDAIKFGIGEDVVKRKDGSIHCGKIVVDSWNNIKKYKDVTDGFIICDEQRLVGSGSWSKTFIKLAKHNPWILLSATPGDRWIDYATIFIARGFYKNITEFKREHVVYNSYAKFPKIERYINEDRLIKYRNSMLVDMPFQRNTKRFVMLKEVNFDKDILDEVVTKRWNTFEGRPIQNISELIILMRRVVNSDSSRIAYIRELMKTKKKLIIFYNFDYELDILRQLSKETTVAEWNGHRHQPVPDTDEWVYLVQYIAGAEAWNCVLTDTIVFYSLQYSYKIFEQSQGRIDRLNTPFVNLYYHVLCSRASIDKVIWNALRNKRDFNLKAFQKIFE